MSILKREANSSSNFASFFFVMKNNSSVYFKLIDSLLWIKGSRQSANFETFECFGKNLPNSSCYFPNHRSVFLQILLHPPVSWNISPLYFFSLNIIYFVQKEPIKVQIIETWVKLLSARIKIRQILHVNFETASQFLFKFSSNLHCHDALSSSVNFKLIHFLL